MMSGPVGQYFLGLFDLRVLGLAKGIPIWTIHRLIPWGIGGYVVNLLVFALALRVGGVHHLGAATIAFCVAVTNNFWLNRHSEGSADNP